MTTPVTPEQVQDIAPKNEHHYIWPSDKAAYRAGFAEAKEAMLALLKPVQR